MLPSAPAEATAYGPVPGSGLRPRSDTGVPGGAGTTKKASL